MSETSSLMKPLAKHAQTRLPSVPEYLYVFNSSVVPTNPRNWGGFGLGDCREFRTQVFWSHDSTEMSTHEADTVGFESSPSRIKMSSSKPGQTITTNTVKWKR